MNCRSFRQDLFCWKSHIVRAKNALKLSRPASLFNGAPPVRYPHPLLEAWKGKLALAPQNQRKGQEGQGRGRFWPKCIIWSDDGDGLWCMSPFWFDYVEKRQFRLSFPIKIIFFQLQIKINSDMKIEKIELVQKGNVCCLFGVIT